MAPGGQDIEADRPLTSMVVSPLVLSTGGSKQEYVGRSKKTLQKYLKYILIDQFLLPHVKLSIHLITSSIETII